VINRDVAFWDRIAQHPEVAPYIFMGREPETLAPLIENPAFQPYASDNGGLIFGPVDHLGFVLELHTLYTPEGWGREVAVHSKAFFQDVFRTASLIVTHEQENHWRSRPPRSHGWQASGDFKEVGMACRLKLWTLSREAWSASPAGRKMQCQ
jgi:hypothetical protein